ncbi:MAG: NAD(P)H-dependent oxidoreductase [Anaerolineales bacterium]|nr:NAD(P)H-dependent oxidoreductase [Anaerolineales bacterium]
MKITIVSTSTRIGRVSHRIALALERSLNGKGQEAKIIDLAEVKLPRFTARYHRHPEQPENWERIMETLKASDGMIFLTPEYNGSISSGLKNFIDVFAKDGFRGKPIGVATGSTGSKGGVRAAYHVQRIILSIFAYPQPQMLLVGEMQHKFDETGRLVDKDFKPVFERFVDQFIQFSALHQGPTS